MKTQRCRTPLLTEILTLRIKEELAHTAWITGAACLAIHYSGSAHGESYKTWEPELAGAMT
jgi:hypothetical protein